MSREDVLRQLKDRGVADPESFLSLTEEFADKMKELSAGSGSSAELPTIYEILSRILTNRQ